MDAWTPAAFIAQHPVFSLDELRAAYRSMGRNPNNARDLVAYHLAQGALLLVRRGLYAHPTWVDPWVLASRLTPDAVIAWDGALSFHKLIGVGHSLHFASTRRSPTLQWNEVIFQVVRLTELPNADFVYSSGQQIRVTSVEKTLVDCLDRLDLAPPLEDLWKAFRNAPHLDSEKLLRHLRNLQRGPLLASRLGLFLEARKRVDYDLRVELAKLGLQAPAYFDRANREKNMRIISRWNLIAGDALLKLADS